MSKCAFVLVLLNLGASAGAATISSNLSNAKSGTEDATGSTWLTASFGTSSASVLDSVTLLLSSPSSGVAEIDLYNDGLLSPGALVGTVGSLVVSDTTLTSTTFSSGSLGLSADSTYWLVLKSLSGEIDWAWTADNTGSGSGFQGTWGLSSDSGSTWYTYAVYPTQLSVSASEVATPEPASVLLFSTGTLSLGLLSWRRRRSKQA